MERAKIGVVGVDSAQLMIVDPMYVDSGGGFVQWSYEKVCRLTEGPAWAGQVDFPLGHPGLAVVFTSGCGDGAYNVYATYDDVPGCGRRIVKVEIDLLTDADAEEDKP